MADADSPVPSALGDLREQLARLDRRLVRLLSERERIQWQVLAYKQALGLPLRDPLQETQVRQRARLAALRSSGDPQLAEDLIVGVMRSGLARYTDRYGTSDVPSPSANPPPALRVARPATPAWLASP